MKLYLKSALQFLLNLGNKELSGKDQIHITAGQGGFVCLRMGCFFKQRQRLTESLMTETKGMMILDSQSENTLLLRNTEAMGSKKMKVLDEKI